MNESILLVYQTELAVIYDSEIDAYVLWKTQASASLKYI